MSASIAHVQSVGLKVTRTTIQPQEKSDRKREKGQAARFFLPHRIIHRPQQKQKNTEKNNNIRISFLSIHGLVFFFFSFYCPTNHPDMRAQPLWQVLIDFRIRCFLIVCLLCLLPEEDSYDDAAAVLFLFPQQYDVDVQPARAKRI